MLPAAPPYHPEDEYHPENRPAAYVQDLALATGIITAGANLAISEEIKVQTVRKLVAYYTASLAVGLELVDAQHIPTPRIA